MTFHNTIKDAKDKMIKHLEKENPGYHIAAAVKNEFVSWDADNTYRKHGCGIYCVTPMTAEDQDKYEQ